MLRATKTFAIDLGKPISFISFSAIFDLSLFLSLYALALLH